MELQRYDEKRKCPKCGGSDIGDQFYEAGDPGMYSGPAFSNWQLRDQPRMDRICRCCSYQWVELPLDSKAEINDIWRTRRRIMKNTKLILGAILGALIGLALGAWAMFKLVLRSIRTATWKRDNHK